MAAQALHFRSKSRVVRQRHATFGTGDDLDRMKTEHGDIAVSAVADRHAAITPADGVRGVLDDLESVLLRERVDRGHIAALTRKMHGDQYLRQRSSTLRSLEFDGERTRTEVIRAGIDIDEIDLRSTIQGAVGRGDERVRGRPQSVARPEPERHASDVQRACRRVDRDRVAATGLAGHRLLKLGYSRPLSQPV